MIRILLSLLLLYASIYPAKATTSFADIPITYDGRIQPISSFADTALQQISGTKTLDEISAQEWLIELLFDPKTASTRPVFKLHDPKHYHLLGLNPRDQKEKLVTITQMMPLSAHPDYIYQIELYMQLMRTFSMFLPLETKEHGILSYLDLQAIDPKHPVLSIIAEGGQKNQVFKVIALPNGQSGEQPTGEYVTPWQIIHQGLGSPQTAKAFDAWKALISAYKAQDKEQWSKAIKQLSSKSWQFDLEHIYHQLMPSHTLTALYWGLAVLMLFSIVWKPSLIRLGLYIISGTVLYHTLTIIARILILSRPPIGTLYESILFVSLIVAGAGCWFGRRNIPLVISSCLISGLLMLISFYIKPQGDEFLLLDAVLNTNFWLATHVICITIGYGWCLVISGLAHLELWKKTPMTSPLHLRSLVMIALIFTIVGTLLGGLWADQSWGRFWGWDPKENGALLIVLWLVWLVHGKMSGHINPVYYLAGLSFLSVIVALSWFGVNLLNVGLHSYGFIEGVALGLFLFCFTEIILIAGLIYRRNNTP